MVSIMFFFFHLKNMSVMIFSKIRMTGNNHGKNTFLSSLSRKYFFFAPKKTIIIVVMCIVKSDVLSDKNKLQAPL